MAGLLSEEV